MVTALTVLLLGLEVGSPVTQQTQRFPITFRQDDSFGSHHMITKVTVSNNGRFDARTETNNHVKLKGNCGRVAIWLLDKDGNVLQANGGKRFCVDAKWALWGKAVRKDQWHFQLAPGVLGKVAGVSILQTNDSVDPLKRIASNLKKVNRVLKACPECKKLGEQAASASAVQTGVQK
jgi:hypothetical protein